MNDTPESDLVARLCNMVSGPHRRGKPFTIRHDAKPENIIEAADLIADMRQTIMDQGAEIEALREREEAQAAEIERLQKDRPWLLDFVLQVANEGHQELADQARAMLRDRDDADRLYQK